MMPPTPCPTSKGTSSSKKGSKGPIHGNKDKPELGKKGKRKLNKEEAVEGMETVAPPAKQMRLTVSSSPAPNLNKPTHKTTDRDDQDSGEFDLGEFFNFELYYKD